MGREAAIEYLAMKTDGAVSGERLIQSDLRELGAAAANLASHAIILTSSLGFGTTFFKFLASVAAIYLLILDRTNWKTNMLTALLIPYIFLSLPSVLFKFLRGDVGKWIAFITVVLRLFFPAASQVSSTLLHHPLGPLSVYWLELPGSLILLLGQRVGAVICLVIGCYLLQEHIRASGGFRNSFTKKHGVSNSIGIILLLVYPTWCLVLKFL
ncbi:unnamed protein product [Spirodela intermedia]|uniref:Uncharacterized protein n=1 Tax=Spirodela intermedia TaxID=51605 RepID=A0A7I8J154_SPIIN|nr:unnamed protein product [Spirodela intermedia]CAA6663050.1 unnamed protein product [Spirodela intermedia]